MPTKKIDGREQDKNYHFCSILVLMSQEHYVVDGKKISSEEFELLNKPEVSFEHIRDRIMTETACREMIKEMNFVTHEAVPGPFIVSQLALELNESENTLKTYLPEMRVMGWIEPSIILRYPSTMNLDNMNVWRIVPGDKVFMSIFWHIAKYDPTILDELIYSNYAADYLHLIDAEYERSLKSLKNLGASPQ